MSELVLKCGCEDGGDCTKITICQTESFIAELESQLAYAEADRIAIAKIRDVKATKARHRYEKAEAQVAAVRESVDTNPCSEFCKGWCDCVDTKMANIRAAIGEEET